MAGLEDCFFQFGLIHHDSPVGSLRVWRQKIPRFLIRQVQKRSKKVKLFDGRATLLDPIPALDRPGKEAGSARHFFSQLRRQLGQAPRGSGWSAAACGGAGALQGALHMPRALWVAANPGTVCQNHLEKNGDAWHL